MSVVEEVRELYPRMIAGDASAVTAFCDKATVDSPLEGKQLPAQFLAETRAWLEHHAATCEQIHTTSTPHRVVHELALHLVLDGEKRELPVMLVADVYAEGDCIRDLRIYHSTWPLSGAHTLRHPLLQYHLAEKPAEPVGTYHQALLDADAASADGVFEPDGTVREPAGSRFTHRGPERTLWYERILADGPIVLHLGSLTDDGETVVYEYMVDRWGSGKLPQQAGAAAYQRGASGKLMSARIYDDVNPPDTIAGE